MDIVADLRDLSQNLASGDSMEAALDAAGLIPLLGKAGDGAKVVKIILKYLKKFPAKAAELSKVMTRVVLKHAPLDSSRAYKAMGYDDAVARLKADGLADGDIERLVGKLDEGESLEDVVRATKIGDEVVYLTRDRLEHIVKRHATGTLGETKPTTFFPTGKVVRDDTAKVPTESLPNRMEADDIDDLIIETIEKADSVEHIWNGNALELSAKVEKYGIDRMTVRVHTASFDRKSAGHIATAFPETGPAVRKWDGAEWKTKN